MSITSHELMALGVGTQFVDCNDEHQIICCVSSILYGSDGPFDFRYTFVMPPRDHPAFDLLAQDDDEPGDVIETRDASFGARGACFRVVK